MKNLKFLLLLMVALSLSFASCTKDDDDDDTDGTGDGTGDVTKKEMLLKKATNKTDDSYAEYLYTADNLLKQITNTSATGDDLGYYDDYTYSNGMLDTYIYYNNSAPSAKVIMTYNGDKPSMAKVMVDQGAGLVDYYDIYYTFNGNNISKLEFKMDLGAGPIVIQESVFTYNGSNVSKMDMSSYDGTALAPAGYVEYSYDSKKNAMHGVGLDYFLGDLIYASANHITMEKSTSAADVVTEAESYNNTYEYNDNDYATKSTSVTFDNLITTVMEFELEEK